MKCGLIVLGLSLAVTARAFVTLDLPVLNAAPPHFGAVAISHLSDGRYVYANNNAIYVQNTFGAAGYSTFATPPGVDPSFVTVLNDTTAMVGAGQFSPTPVYQFNPSSPATPGYSSVATLQNFSAARASAAALYVVGANGVAGDGGNNSVSYVTTAGAQQLVVDPAGTYSAGLAVDGGGNVFVGDNDNNSIYEFTSAQLVNALTNSHVLTFADGILVHTFAADVVGSLAVDALGRVWAAGFGADGLFWVNPATSATGSLTPEASGGAYNLSAFSTGGEDYLSFVWQSGFATNSTVVYGYDRVQNVPEPATSALIVATAAGAAAWWRRRRSPAVAKAKLPS